VQDAARAECTGCGCAFAAASWSATLLLGGSGKHHCRICGDVFCNVCAPVRDHIALPVRRHPSCSSCSCSSSSSSLLRRLAIPLLATAWLTGAVLSSVCPAAAKLPR
jgi:hypothetical protein